jgi:hypothetical protein
MMKLSPKISLLLLAFLGLAAAGLILYVTTWGPVIFSDATGYLTVARNILAGNGIGSYEASGNFGVMTLHPPFYSILLAFFGLTGLDVVVITRWLQALSFGLVVFFSGLGLWRLSNSLWLGVCGALTLLASPLLLYLFTLAMSEPPFLLFSVSATLALLLALRQGSFKWLALAAICAGLSVVTRLVGLAWVTVGVLMVAIFWPGGWKGRLAAVLCHGGIGILPFALWQGWVQFIVHPESRVRAALQLGKSLMEFRLAVVEIFLSWLPFATRLPNVHYRIKLLMILALAALSIGLTILAIWRVARRNRSDAAPLIQAASLLWLSLMAYLGMAAAGYVVTNPTPDLNDRTLSPTLLIALGLTFVTCAAIYRAWPTQPWRHALPLVCAGVIVASGWQQSIKMLQDYHQSGNGYLSQSWRQSATLLAAMELPADTPLISNEFSALAFWVGRPVYPINEVVALKSQDLNVRFGDDAADDAQRVFRERGAALVIFDTIRWQLDPLYFDQTSDRLAAMTRGLTVYGDYGDGAIYFYPAEK